MKELIEKKIAHITDYYGYTRAEATEIVTRALNNIRNGNKPITDLFSVEELKGIKS